MARDHAFAPESLASDRLRWVCDPASLPFDTTEEVTPLDTVAGQDEAVAALEFGLRIDAPGQHVFVRGAAGTGRMTLVRSLIGDIEPHAPSQPDYVYVRNFDSPDRPRVLSLPRGQGDAFQKTMEDFVEFVRHELGPGLEGEHARARRKAIEARSRAEMTALSEPLEIELKEAGLGLMLAKDGNMARPVIVPLVEGKPAPPDVLQALVGAEKISREELAALEPKAAAFADRLASLERSLAGIQRARKEAMRTAVREDARALVTSELSNIRQAFEGDAIGAHLDALADDVIEHGIVHLDQSAALVARYGVNLISSGAAAEHPPVIIENAPSVQTLLGTIDRAVLPDGSSRTDHNMIHGGALLRANGGYLILEAADVVSTPGAWRALMRTLRSGTIDMVPPELPTTYRAPAIQPDPIPIKTKIILLGETGLYYKLDALDPEFSRHFKVLADFENVIPRGADSVVQYAGYLSWLRKTEGIPPFDRTGVAALAEHGARVAARDGQLTARFGRLGDLAREAAFLAVNRGGGPVRAEHVRDAVRRTKRRAESPARRFRESVRTGQIRIHTVGTAVGQVNGLAVIHAGPLAYGFPSRITATIGPGHAGTINIEREAQLSGAIHTKGFYILGGLLRYLLRTDHPLAFSASVAFEQSYGGIDGDSASGAEMCCLLSALTDVPLKQSLAMTGAIDQVGNILPIGAVNEKVEGFFDTCCHTCDHDELDGSQGVIVPTANAGDLQLRLDVVEACRAGRFHVWAVSTIHEALALFTGVDPGIRVDDAYPEGTLLRSAVDQAGRFWEMAAGR